MEKHGLTVTITHVHHMKNKNGVVNMVMVTKTHLQPIKLVVLVVVDMVALVFVLQLNLNFLELINLDLVVKLVVNTVIVRHVINIYSVVLIIICVCLNILVVLGVEKIKDVMCVTFKLNQPKLNQHQPKLNQHQPKLNQHKLNQPKLNQPKLNQHQPKLNQHQPKLNHNNLKDSIKTIPLNNKVNHK